MLEQSGCPHGDMYTYTHYLCNMFWCNRLIVDKTLHVDEYYDAELIHPQFYYTSFPEFRCTGSIDAIESKGRKLFVV